MGVVAFLSSWQFVLFFYLFIIGLVYFYRNKFEFQAKFIALYKTNLGLKLMNLMGTKLGPVIRWLGYIGIIVGYLGMLAIVFFIFQGMYNLIAVPGAPPTISPVIPGVKIPGSPIFVPFWYGIVSLFVVIVIHEFSHGVVSRAHKVPVRSSGFVLFGPLPGAFVEPDEKILLKKKPSVQNSVFAAGPFSNIITAAIVVLLFFTVINPWVTDNFIPNGVSFSHITPGSPAELGGLEKSVVYDHVRGEKVNNALEFVEELEGLKPGEEINIGNDEVTKLVVAVEHPDKEGEGYLGVNIVTRFRNDDSKRFSLARIVIELLNWIFLLSLGLGLANLLPIGPVDGGRMFQIGCRSLFGEKKGDLVWSKTSVIFLFLILILLIIPILRAII